MNKYEKIVEAIRSGEMSGENLDQMFWAAERGHDFPLPHYDVETWEGSVREGDPSATAISNLQNAIRHVESEVSVQSLGLEKFSEDVEHVRASLIMNVADEQFRSNYTMEGGASEMSRALIAAFSRVRPEMIATYQRSLEYAGLSEAAPPPEEWGVEVCGDGLYRAVNREHRLALFVPAESMSAARECADTLKWNDHNAMRCAKRYEEMVAMGRILENDSPEPS